MTTPERLAKVAEVLCEHVAHYHGGSGHAVCDCDGWEFWGNLPDFMKATQRHQAEMLAPLLDEFAAQDYAAGASSVIAYPERVLAEAWDEGHMHRWRRGPDGCTCAAWSPGECACGQFGTGALLSLVDNPYRTPQTHATAPLSDAQPERESDSHRHGNGAQNGREDA